MAFRRFLDPVYFTNLNFLNILMEEGGENEEGDEDAHQLDVFVAVLERVRRHLRIAPEIKQHSQVERVP
jgi:hypothetical protein